MRRMISRVDNGKWVPPGGMVELAEPPTDAVVREVREETGVLVCPEVLTGVYKHMGVASIVLGFRCRVVDAAGQARSTSEAREVAWLDVDQAARLIPPALAVRVLDAAGGGGPFVRAHDGIRLLDGLDAAQVA